LFQHLGVSAQDATIPDNQGRPQYLVDDGGKVIPELV
jgi:hypothetical protein